jgi:hypothetical protein
MTWQRRDQLEMRHTEWPAATGIREMDICSYKRIADTQLDTTLGRYVPTQVCGMQHPIRSPGCRPSPILRNFRRPVDAIGVWSANLPEPENHFNEATQGAENLD